MFLVIGKENCSRCNIVKQIFDRKHIKYTYCLLDDLPNKKKFIELARKNNKLEMPLIIKDDELVDIGEVE